MPSFCAEHRFIVAGASSGIGKAIALRLNACGATVIALARSSEKLSSLRAEAPQPERIFIEQIDLTADIAALPAFVSTLKGRYGKFQGMAFCAGTGTVKPVRAVDLEEVRGIFDINFFAPFMMAKAFADKRNHNGKGTSCVFISSVAAIRCDKGQSIYASSKAALAAAIKCIGRECAPAGVRFNCVSPAAIRTPLLATNDPDALAQQEALYPMGLGSVDDVAGLVTFLLSDKAKWITTQNYVIDCGAVL